MAREGSWQHTLRLMLGAVAEIVGTLIFALAIIAALLWVLWVFVGPRLARADVFGRTCRPVIQAHYGAGVPVPRPGLSFS